uniref:Large ribosomal subunit protein uL6c n=1 Tax=Schimmelmannia schousboei TaxID=173468 RepID=A0A1C9C930_9FLOR|nr:ribosomal protein L6 [Schimmelmannia schousboei]AOM64869.1 ribosomal protein L6 [Schimmelmannia schousboei]
MSRIGKKTIIIPDKINTQIKNSTIYVEGPKGQLSYCMSEKLKIQKDDKEITISRIHNNKESQALHGLSRTIINNMIIGVTKGFEKKLEIKGVGYRCQMQGKNLILNVGYSHPIEIKPHKDIAIQVENNTSIIVSGINKELVGKIAAQIREIRPPEPYKGKGIRYHNENVRRKVGKAGK